MGGSVGVWVGMGVVVEVDSKVAVGPTVLVGGKVGTVVVDEPQEASVKVRSK